MDPLAMAELLLADVELTPDQLAQLRAINTKYFTELAALQRHTTDPNLALLHASVARDVRDILTEEQRVAFDRRWPGAGTPS